MLTLNLIPESTKEHVRMLRLYRMLRTSLVVVALFTLIIAIIILIGRLILQQQFTRIVNETTLVTTNNRAVETKIRDLNSKVGTAKKILGSTHPWAETVFSILEIMPGGITIDSISLDAEGKSTINGKAKTRDELLAFKAALEAAPYATNVGLPITDLLKREDAIFSINFTLKPDAVSKR